MNSQLVVLSSLPELLFHCSQHTGSLEAERDVVQGFFQRIGEFHRHRHFFTSYRLTLGLQDKERTMLHKPIIIKCSMVKSVGLNTQKKIVGWAHRYHCRFFYPLQFSLKPHGRSRGRPSFP